MPLLFSEHGNLTVYSRVDYNARGDKTFESVPSHSTNSTEGTTFISYDALGRVKAIEHASGIKVAYEYEQYGNLLKVKNAGSGFVYQENLQADALQNITQSEKNNGTLYESRAYDPVSGQLKQVNASSATGNELHNIEYYYGSFGNLASQTVHSNNGASSSTESYSYDDLHRLTYSSLSSGGSISYSYDATGNLTQKSDYASSMSYGSAGKNNTGNAGPNAVLSATLVGGSATSFTYDNNGNLISGAGKTITYNAMNKPTQISAGGTTVSFSYDANWQRYKKVIGSSRTLYYIDGSVEVEYTGGDIITRTYIDDIAVIKRTKHSGLALPSHEITYTLRDRLGSVVTLTNHNNLIMEHRSYDPFGKPRFGTMQASPSATLFNVASGTPFTMRGFTDHEHIDEAQLIHMNGRVYDYNLGRFLSVDPAIQDPYNSQSLNPYSYIMNNPLSGTDPTGYCSEGETLKGCAGSLEEGETRAVTNEKGETVGHVGKDANGNLHVTSNGKDAGQAAIRGTLALASNLPAQIGGPQNNPEVTATQNAATASEPSSAGGINISSLTASTNEMAGAAQTEALTEAQALFLKEHDLSLKDFGSLINALRAIRGLGQLIDEQADFVSAVNKLNGEQLQMLADLLEIPDGGISRSSPDLGRVIIISIYQRRTLQKSLIFGRNLGESAASLIYVDPRINAFKSTLPRNVRRALDAYDNFEKLRHTLEEAEK